MDLTTTTRSPLDRPAITAEMLGLFQDAFREMKCVGSQRLLRRGVSMSNLHIMSMLERHGELTMSRLAEALDVSFSNATGLVDRMEERGLVERVRVPDDRRIVIVRLTDDGRAALNDIEYVRAEMFARVVDRLDDRQLARVVAALDDVRAAIIAVAADDPELFAHNHRFHDADPAPAGRTQE
jgi:DNA-binding MarR family transcriptional regulator